MAKQGDYCGTVVSEMQLRQRPAATGQVAAPARRSWTIQLVPSGSLKARNEL